jgi:hypothetical protein
VDEPRRDPGDVFTPAGALTPGMFASRSHRRLEVALVDALSEVGRHIALYGWTGVGKTSLVEHVCSELAITYVTADCGGTVDEILAYALSQLDARVRTEIVKQEQRSREGSGGLAGAVMGKMGRQDSNEQRFSSFAGPVETVLVDALVAAEASILFIDNLEELTGDEHERRRICRLVKLCSGRTRDLKGAAPKVILAGPEPVIDEILRLDEGVARRTLPLEVPRMHPSEIEEILSHGEALLSIEFDHSCRRRIVDHADGFPYYAHLFALHSVRQALRDGRSTVSVQDFDRALEGIIVACSRSLQDTYGRATRGPGQAALRQGALTALAGSSEIEMSLPQLRTAFLAVHPQYERVERVQFIGAILKEFRDEFGILEDAWLPNGQRGYRFHDPMMRVFVRLKALSDRNSAAAMWRSSLPHLADP